jgi:hypothetical protein
MLASPAAFAGGAGNGDPSAGNSGATSGGSTAGNSANNNNGAPAAPAASTQPASAPVKPSPSSAELQSEIDAMRALVQSQSDQIQKQQEELAEMKAKLAGNNSNSPAQPAPSSSISTAAPVAGVPAIAAQPSVPAVTSTPVSTIESSSLSTPGSPAGEEHSPLFFKIGDAKFTPGGFMDATAVFRTTGTGFGIGASFGSVPYNTSLPAAGLTETRFSVQNSRISMRVDVPLGGATVTGYYEADFLGLTAANANVTSNANTFRSRLYFADYNRGHWEFLAGQTWSLLTPGRSGISPWPGDIFFSQDMDTNYQVGLTWARQLGFRVVYHPDKVWAFAFAVENPDQLVGSAETFPSAFTPSSTVPTGEVDTASGSTLSTPPTANYMPDFIFKIAVDPKVGERHLHFDFAGLLSNFKLVTPGSVLSSTAGTPRQTETATGGGFEVGANMELFKNFRLIGQGYWSDGGGRYIYGLGPDIVVRQATTTSPFVPSPVKGESSILGFEWQAQPKMMIYGYYGGAEFVRDYSYQPVATGTPTTFVGYGYPAAPSTQNRAIQEGTIGWTQDFFKSPNIGKFSLLTQASYLTRDPWTAGANPRNAHLVEVYVDIRYTLP